MLLRNGGMSTNQLGGSCEGNSYKWWEVGDWSHIQLGGEMEGWPPEICGKREVETRAIPQALMSWYRSATHNEDICFQLEHIN